MVQQIIFTRDEVKSAIAELDAAHPTWANIYMNEDDWLPYGDVDFHPDAYTYDEYKWLLGEDE